MTRRPSATVRLRFASDIMSALYFVADDPGAAAHGRPAVPDHFRLHRLALAAVRDGKDLEIVADGINGPEELGGMAGNAAIAEEFPEFAVPDLIEQARGEAKVLARFGDGGDAVADHIVAALHVLQNA